MSAAAGGTQQSTIDLDPLEVAAARDDMYVNPLSLFVEATQALNWQRERLRETVLKQGAYLMTGTPHHTYYEEAANKIYSQLSWLTYCRTFYTAKALMSCETWNRGVGFKLNVKSKMPYQAKKYLLTISTERRGQPVEWMMDLQGTDSFPEELVDESSVKLLLKTIGERVKSYAHQKRFRSMRTSDGDYMVFNMQKQPIDEMTDYTVDKSEEAEKLIDALVSDEAAGIIENTIHEPKRLGLGFVPLKGEIHPPENDADVTYNPDRRFKYKKNVPTVPFGEISVQVTKNFSARRQWGTFVEMENKNTIDFINNMMPLIGSGWFEIILQRQDKTRLHFKLTPWGEPKTTFVQPFRISALKSPMMFKDATVEQIAAQAFDFRTEGAQDVIVNRLEPYLISGKGNEIDGMVHSILAFDEKTRRKAHDVCKHIIDTELAKEDPNTKIEIMSFMRAYYSTDSNGPSGSLCPFGERSIFFFNVQGEIAGVEMSSPSIRVVNQFVPRSEPTVGRRKRDSSSESRGDDEQERGSGRRGRFERDGRSASRTRSNHAMPPPPGFAAHVPESIMEEMRETRSLVQDLLKAMHAGQPAQQGQAQNQAQNGSGTDEMIQTILRNMSEMQAQLKEKKKGKGDSSDDSSDDEADNEDRVATRSTSKKEEFAVDPTNGWEACVTDKAPDRCPKTISVSGIPVFPQRLNEPTDTLELVQDDNPLVFKLDRDYTNREGAIIYKNDENNNLMFIYPQPEITKGVMNDPYYWQIRFARAEGDSYMHKGIDSNILVQQYRNEKLWFMSKDLRKEFNTKKKFLPVKITILPDIEMVTRNEVWKRRQNKERVIMKRNKQTNALETSFLKNEYTLDQSTLTTGCGGDLYLAKMFRDFGRMPYNDRSGMLPARIRLIIDKSSCVIQGTQEQRNQDLELELELVDTKIPLYTADHVHNGNNYVIQIKPYYSISRKGYTWGILTNIGLDMAPEFCAFIEIHNSEKNTDGQIVQKEDFPHELCNASQPDRWKFDFTWDTGEQIQSGGGNIIIEYPDEDYRERTPYIENKNKTKDQELELKEGIFKAMNSERLAFRYRSTDPLRLKAVAEYLKQMETTDRLPHFGLFLFHKDFSAFINQKINGRKLQKDSVPKKIRLNHPYLNGDKAMTSGNNYPEADYILYLVDLQGPVWVSENGLYMVSPYANSKKNYKTWALWRWNEKKAAYIIFAEKSSQGENKNKHLINDTEYEFDKRNDIHSHWTFYSQWNGKIKSADEMSRQRFTDMRVTIVHDPRPTNREYKDKSGKTHLQNPYHLYQRMPDFSVEKTEDDFFRIQQGRMFEATKAAKRKAEKDGTPMKCAFDPQPDDDDVIFGLAAGDQVINDGKDAYKNNSHLVDAQTTKADNAAQTREKAVQQKKAENEVVVEEQKLPTQKDFETTLLDSIRAVTRTINRNQAKRDSQDAEVEKMDVSTKEQIERQTKLKKQINARKKMEKNILQKLFDFSKEKFVNMTFINVWDNMKIPQMRDEMKIIAETEAKVQKEINLFLYESDEDKQKLEKIIKNVVDETIEEALLTTFKAMDFHKKKVAEKAEAERIRKIRYDEAQKALAERREKDAAAADANRKKQMLDPTIDITWESTQGVENTDDITNDDAFEAEAVDAKVQEAEAKAHEAEVDYSKHESIVLADPLISEVTPWTEIMEMYRSFLVREKAVKDEKTKLYRERMERTNTAQMELKKKQEEEEMAEDKRRSDEKQRLQKAKFQIEQEMEKRNRHQKPLQNSEGYNVLQQCRVYSDSNSDLVPYSIKARLKLGSEYEVLDCEFFVQNPFSMRYDCHDPPLRLQPEKINIDIDGTQAYAWKLYLISVSSMSADEIELAVKWNKPNVLIQTNEITEEENNAKDWRSRVNSLRNVLLYRKKKGVTWDDVKKNVEDSFLNEVVWYRGMTFDKTKKDFKGEVLPLMHLDMPQYRGGRDRLYTYSEPEVAEIIRATLTKVWNLDVLRNNIMKIFEFPTVLFLTMKIVNMESTRPFIMQKHRKDDLFAEEIAIRWSWKGPNGMLFNIINAFSVPDREGKKIGNWFMTVSGKDKTEEKEHDDLEIYVKGSKFLLDSDPDWVVVDTEGVYNESQKRVFDEALRILKLDTDKTKKIHITTENTHKLTHSVNGKNVELVSNLRVSSELGIAHLDKKRTQVRVKYIESEANEFDIGHYTNKMMLMSKIAADYTRSREPAEISEECEGGLASPRTGARRALASRALPPVAVQLLPLQSRKQAQQERKRLSVTAPPPRSLPVLSKRLHGH